MNLVIVDPRPVQDGSGNVIDPTNLANAGTIIENIKKSFHAFEDDDRDGRE